MPITVKLHGRIRIAAGVSEITISESVRTISDLLEELIRRFGDDFRRYVFGLGREDLSGNIVLLVDGHSIRMLEGLHTQLRTGNTVTMDTVDILEVVGGG